MFGFLKKKREIIDANVVENPLLHKPCENVDVAEGLKIAEKLFEILKTRDDGIGLACNQVGIDSRVAVINPKKYKSELEPIILINPKITRMARPIGFDEACLSFPEKSAKTTRFKDVEVESDAWEGVKFFHGITAIAIQHEVDHLNGVTMFDRERKPMKSVSEKVGRNAPCPCGSGKKFKKCCIGE